MAQLSDSDRKALSSLIEVARQIECAGDARVKIAPDLRIALTSALSRCGAAKEKL